MSKRLAKLLIEEAKNLGVRNIWIDVTRRHFHLCGIVGDREIRFPFAKTPSDHRTPKNTVHGLRRLVRSLSAEIRT